MSTSKSEKINNAYGIVFRDMMLNGPDLFKGICDKRHGNRMYMYGIQDVMNYIAIRSSEETYEQFDSMFLRNIVNVFWDTFDDEEIKK